MPLRVVHFGSLFRFVVPPEWRFGILFFYHLAARGIFTWEGRTCFLSTAHTAVDLEQVIEAVQASALALRDEGWAPDGTVPPELAERPELQAVSEVLRRERALAEVSPADPSALSPWLAELPPTDAQRQLWVLSQLDEDASRAYNESRVLHLSGLLSVPALVHALARVVERHDALRATFSADGETLRVARTSAVELHQVDLSAAAEPGAAAFSLARREAAERFDFERGPLIRALLLRLRDDQHRLVLTCHHVILDGRSLSLLLAELSDLYRGELTGAPANLPPALSLASFLSREQQRQAGNESARALEYWVDELGARAPVLDLPYDRPRPPVVTYRGGYEARFIAAPLPAALSALGSRLGATPSVLLLAAVAAWLHRLSGQDEVVVGMPAAGLADRAKVFLGYDLNLLPIVSRAGGDPIFLDLVAALRRRVLSAYEHRDFSFRALIKAMGLHAGAARHPLVSVVFNREQGEARAAFGNLEMTLGANPSGARFELFLNVTDRGRDLHLEADYNADLFDGATVSRLLGNLEVLLRGAAGTPQLRVSELPLLRSSERHQILREWNDTSALYHRDRLVHQLFLEQAKRSPDAVAVVFEAERLTYGELDRRVRLLAHQLLALGLSRGERVGLFLPRSPEMVVALLGILAAGGVYVPLAASFPLARRQWILARLEARFLITHPAHLPETAALARELPRLEHLVCFGGRPAVPPPLLAHQRLWATADAQQRPTGDLPASGGAEDEAYIIFTSGSTGTPKGVVVRHRPVVNLIEWVNHTFAVSAADRVLLVASLTFDLSVYDIFGLLAAGGSIHVASEADIEEPRRLIELLRREPITFWDSAPAALQQLAPYFTEASEDELHLGLVLLSGDWIPVTLPDAVRGAFPRARVVALGGATEATVWSNSFPIGEVSPRWVSIPYGRPIQNARYHVLDSRLELCPIGVAGDLFIGGECLASSYAAEPELTAWKFIPDPWSPLPGGRLYRTGDRARHWPSGTLEFLGRLDHQVKIRGYRIELGEIEVALGQHPEVSAAAAVVREDRPGQRRLVAYVVPRSAAAPAPAELSAFLAERLPDYMVPAVLVLLDRLPVTPNGKLDRAALPAPEAARAAEEDSFVPPRTPAEKLLAGLWSELLGIARIGIHDRFFELGGDSILSIQLVARAARAGLRLSPRLIFQNPTIAALAVATGVEAAAAEQGPVAGDVPTTPALGWFLEQDLADPHRFNQSILLASRRRLAPVALAGALEAIVAHHDALRLRLSRDGAAGRFWIAAAEPHSLLLHVDLAGLPAEHRRGGVAATASQVQASLDLAQGPLLRAALLRLGGAEPDRLLIVVHHIAVDGVSWRVLLDDLGSAYANLEQMLPVELPAKTTSFRRWAELLSERAATPEVERSAELWLAGTPPVREPLPLDFPAPADTVAAARTVETALDAEATRALLRESVTRLQAEVYEVLLAALARTLTAWSAGSGLWIDLEGHGREEDAVAEGVDLSRTVGWLTSFFPLWLPVDAGLDAGAALAVTRTRLRALQGRGLDHGLLLHMSGKTRIAERLRSLPRAEAVFNYLGQMDSALAADSPFALAAEATGGDRSPSQRRRHRLEISAYVAGGRLHVVWTWGGTTHRRATIEALARELLAALQSLLRGTAVREPSPADFPLARLDSSEVSRLVALMAAADGVTATTAARDLEDAYPLSPLQESMLFHGLAVPGSRASVEQTACSLRGALDINAFERAWRRIVERHPILRTAFLVGDLAQPLQVVRRSVPLPLRLEDWRALPAAERDRRLTALLAADRGSGFRFDSAPLLRLTLIRTEADAWELVWTYHHLILDGWCRVALLGETFRTYAAFAAGEDPALPAPRPFRDYISWLGRQDPMGLEAFWRRTFAGCSGPQPIRVDRLPGPRSDGYAIERVRIDEASSARLSAAARCASVTLGTLLQAGWALLLGRYGEVEDVVFGVTVSGRPADLPGVDSMLGMFINNLPVRLEVPAAAPVLPWLQRFQGWQGDLRQFEHSGPTQVQEWSGLPLGQRLFESLVVFQNYPLAAGPELAVDTSLRVVFRSATLETAYPLTLVIEPGLELALELGHQLRFVEPVTAARLLHHFAALLADLAGDPERALGFLSLWSPAEQRQLLAVEAANGVPVSPSATVSAWAERRPDAVALMVEGAHFTYRALAAGGAGQIFDLTAVLGEPEGQGTVPRAADLAMQLDGLWRAIGIGEGDLCAVLLPPSAHPPREAVAPLLAGATLWLVRPEELCDGAADALDVLIASPTQLQRLAAAWPGRVRAIVCRGEELSRGLADRLLERCDTLFKAHCGPWSAIARVVAGEDPVDLGQPLAGGRLVVVANPSEPAPLGVPGDLCTLSGLGSLTPAGQMARVLPGGAVELLGTRGWAEAGEVEALLRRHPAILGAAVTTGTAGDRCAMAWIACAPEKLVDAGELRSFLRQLLPVGMLPAAFSIVPSLPLAADGTADRAALEATVGSRSMLREVRVRPRDELEWEILRLWEDILDRRPLGIRDSFFDLGGQSLVAVRLMAHLRDRFGHDLPLSILFENSTVEQLAERLRQESPGHAWSPLVPIQTGGDRPPLFLVHPAGGGVLGYLDLARHLGPDQPVYGLQAPGQLAHQRPLESIAELAALYIEAIRTVQPRGPYRLGGRSFGGCAAFEMARQLSGAGERAGLVVLLDTDIQLGQTEPDPCEYLHVLVRETLPEIAHNLPRERPLGEQLAWVLATLQQLDKVPPGFAQEDMDRYFHLYWINVLAGYHYRPHPYAGPLLLLRATDNPPGGEPDLGWGPFAAGGLEIMEVPGTHHSLIQPPNVEAVAARLRARLERRAEEEAHSATGIAHSPGIDLRLPDGLHA
ncbi:MAG TPA: amino acid adenylation domain-containing protein [Thermoanaerobaculia bacterium]|nr:amino acid adenylation domain-containing protein [Thermoanaerobaculia bacterium]